MIVPTIRTALLSAIAIALLACTLALAGETIASDTWEYEAPPGWSMDLTARPPKSVGPNGELVQFSSAKMPRASEGSEARASRLKVEELSLKVITDGAKASDLEVTQPLKKTDLSPEITMYEIATRDRKDQSVMFQFVLIGPQAAVLVTYEAAAPGASVDLIRKALKAIKWTV